MYKCHFHVVWCPKYRRKVLHSGVDVRLKELIREVCTELDCPLTELEVMPDHVHMLVEVDPQFGIHKLVKRIKGRSSRILRDEFPWLKSRIPTLWTNSYFVATTGGAPLHVVKKYIKNQKKYNHQICRASSPRLKSGASARRLVTKRYQKLGRYRRHLLELKNVLARGVENANQGG